MASSRAYNPSTQPTSSSPAFSSQGSASTSAASYASHPLSSSSVVNIPYGADKLVEFALWDTAGQEEYDRLRPLSYPETDVLLVCFALDYPTSLDNVVDKWYPEISHFCEGVPLLLIGTKSDLRTDRTALDLLRAQGREPITFAQGSAVARSMGARYFEVSSKTGEGVAGVFDAALREGMRGTTLASVVGMKRKARCGIL
ncbi:hypothetical protein P7C70_g8976, partial [Phenoliferia sp. Uapishka_3]